MKIECSKELMQEICGHLGSVVEEVNLHFDEKGMWVKAVDSCHVIALDLKVDKTAFLHYDVFAKESEKKEEELGVDLDVLKTCLKQITGKHVCLEWKEPPVKFNIVYDAGSFEENEGKVTLTYEAPDMVGIKELKMNWNFDTLCEISLNPDELYKFLMAGSRVASECIELKQDSNVFISIRGEKGRAQLEIPATSVLKKHDKILQSLFPLDYFQNSIMACRNTPKINMRFGQDCPVVIKAVTKWGPWNEGELDCTYYLAPRIEEK
jgi:hypothetical protein